MPNARPAQNKTFSFSEEEQTALLEDALRGLALPAKQTDTIRETVRRLWADVGGWWYGHKLNAFVWLPVLVRLAADFQKKRTELACAVKDVLPMSPRPQKVKAFFMTLARVPDTPLDKSLLAWLWSAYERAGKAEEFSRLIGKIFDASESHPLSEPQESFPPQWFSLLCPHKEATGAASGPLGFWRSLEGIPVADRTPDVDMSAAEKLFAPAWDCLARRHKVWELRQKEERKKREQAVLADLHRRRLQALLQADTRRNGYPALEESLLHDPLRGHWDLWPPDANPHDQSRQTVQTKDGLMARNPKGDIQKRVPVCIDFGTSSTVVALRENGRKRLLRVGVSDWSEEIRARHFENPTALEFINASAFAGKWQHEQWRPPVRWTSLKCSHQARNDISPVASPETLYSIIGDLKTWARLAADRPPLDMRDQQGTELRLTPGNAAPENGGLALNPLEIYAFYLGLAINNQYRENGRIYHEYHLSFPATFDSATRQDILEAFGRGLERSLPASLAHQSQWRAETPFSVREGAAEPVAYAAAVLEESDLEPTDRGLAFGVFDFGGGTTDFAFGLYRRASQEEERHKGWESVLQLLDVTGDADLGGEALLHMLSFAVMCDNADTLLAKALPFVLPRTAQAPAGMERIFGDSLAARANTTRLMEALRPLWEKGPDAFDSENEGLLRLDMQNHNGGNASLVELKADKEKLTALLHDRILQGVSAFFIAFRQAFKRHNVEGMDTLHILPAGNACRSPLVHACFVEHMQAIARQENFKADHFRLHDVRLPDDANPEAVTLKTGVALGLLNTVPGESVGILPVPELADPDTVFRYAFGTFRRGMLEPLLTRFSAPGEWHSLGFVRADLRQIVAHTESPLALEGRILRGDPACTETVIDWKPGDVGHEAFVRPVGQDTVEVALDVGHELPQGRDNFTLSLSNTRP